LQVDAGELEICGIFAPADRITSRVENTVLSDAPHDLRALCEESFIALIKHNA